MKRFARVFPILMVSLSCATAVAFGAQGAPALKEDYTMWDGLVAVGIVAIGMINFLALIATAVERARYLRRHLNKEDGNDSGKN